MTRPGTTINAMTDMQTDHVLNGQIPGPIPGVTPPAPAAEDCDDCVTFGERSLAIIAGIIGLAALLIAVDMFSGGRIFGYVKQQLTPPAGP